MQKPPSTERFSIVILVCNDNKLIHFHTFVVRSDNAQMSQKLWDEIPCTVLLTSSLVPLTCCTKSLSKNVYQTLCFCSEGVLHTRKMMLYIDKYGYLLDLTAWEALRIWSDIILFSKCSNYNNYCINSCVIIKKSFDVKRSVIYKHFC